MSEQPPVDGASDEDLLARTATGDAQAFTQLFRRRNGEVYRFALHMTGAAPAAEDVTQEVFLTLIGAARKFEPGRASVVAWLLGIARNVARRHLERERGHVPLDDSDDEDLPVVHLDPVGDLTRAERVDALRRAILTLPLAYREAVVLCDLQELTYVEAAQATGCAVGTMKSRLHRGRALLASKLAASEHQQPVSRRDARCFA